MQKSNFFSDFQGHEPTQGRQGRRSCALRWPLEALPDAEKEVEVPGLTDMRVGRRRRGRVVVKNGVDGWIEVVAEVSAYWPNGCVVAEPQPQGVGEVIEIAGIGRVVGGVGRGDIAA